jgi:hypothetical protein
MPSLYVSVYQARAPKLGHTSKTAIAFYEAVRSDFPYDLGDDPAFFSARYHHGPVTWVSVVPAPRASGSDGGLGL